MAYQHDIFISYKRHPETLEWIRRHFLPLLQLRVGLVTGVDPDIYVHEVTAQVPAGTTWPVELGEKLGASRVLVVLWTKTYLHSEWCALEMSHMLGREIDNARRTPENKYGLVIPAVIHDGEDFPNELDFIQRMDIKSCFNTRMLQNSRRAEELSDLIDVHAAGIAAAIKHAPDWQETWPRQIAEDFFRQFYVAARPVQASVPKFQP